MSGAEPSVDINTFIKAARIEERVAMLIDSAAWPADRLAAWCEERLLATLEAAAGSRFWRERIGGAPGLGEIPPLDRETLRSEFAAIAHTTAVGPMITRQTSGSTGRPVRVVHGPEQVGFASAARLRQLAWFGLGTAEQPTANVWAKKSAKDPALSRSDGEAVDFRINHWALTPQTLPAAHAEIVAAGGVRLVGGTTSMLEHWADLYEGSGLSGDELGVRLAIVGGEMTYPEQRARIERQFGCPTALMYGSWEAPMIACECPAGSLHVNEEVVLVEVVLPDGTAAAPGEFGDVAVTLLHNPQFPLIRYLLGDSASWSEGPCECGRPHRALALEVARREDLISCRDGRRLHPRVIRSTLERELGAELRAFHSTQPAPGRFEVGIAAEHPPTGRLQELVAEELRTCMREPITVAIREIDEAEVGRLRGGKLRTFTNRIEGS